MQVADRDVCRTLHALSGWEDTAVRWRSDGSTAPDGAPGDDGVPAYDLGYLLRRLPTNLRGHLPYAKYSSYPLTIRAKQHGYRVFYHYRLPTGQPLSFEATAPEHAAAQLAIALFRHGLLTRT